MNVEAVVERAMKSSSTVRLISETSMTALAFSAGYAIEYENLSLFTISFIIVLSVLFGRAMCWVGRFGFLAAAAVMISREEKRKQ